MDDTALFGLRKLGRYAALIMLCVCVTSGCDDNKPTQPRPPIYGPDWTSFPSGSWADGRSVFFTRASDSTHPVACCRVFYPEGGTVEVAQQYLWYARVSPCGDKIAFIGRDANLWVQDISHGLHASQPEMVVQAGPFETLADIGWRGCNDLLYSEALDFGIRQINLTTRDSIVLAESDRFPSASRDGSVVVYHGVYSLMKLEHGDTTRIFTQDSTESIRAVEVSPDGKHVVYERMILGYAPDSAWIVQLYSLVLVDVATGFKRELQITGRDPAWLSDDRIVFCRMIRHDPEGNSQVWTCDTSGTDLQQLTNLNMLWK